jgi:hypothetical protein
MNNVYLNFYKKFYLHTGGFIPSVPDNENIYPGDFFQIRNGEKIMLGNIFRNQIIDTDDCKFGYGIKLNPAAWIFNDGVTTTNEKENFLFLNRGSFFYKGSKPEAVKIVNWNDLQQELIVKLTQVRYSFRELYLVTEVASTTQATVAIAAANEAELAIESGDDEFGNLLVNTSLQKNIEYYNRTTARKPCYYKAKKLVVKEEKLQSFISDLVFNSESQNQWAKNFFNYDFQYEDNAATQIPAASQVSMLDMLQPNELTPGTALLYFKWDDANLDDINKLFAV